MKNKFCREILSLLLMTLLFLHSSGQQKALQIGDPIPEKVWTTPFEVVNSPQKTIDLSADKDKLILLDFWATWCSGCLLNFPKMEALQKQFGDQLKIIPVTKENRATLEKFFASKNGQRYNKNFSVAGDKLFHEYFPHNGVPYIIWIKDGKVLNTTDAEQVTEQTITAILGNDQTPLQTVVQMDRERPLMLSENFDLEKSTSLLSYSFLSKGRIRGMAFGSGFHRQGDIVYGRQFTNRPLVSIYRGITQELFQQRGEIFSKKRIKNLVKVPADIDFNSYLEGEKSNAKLFNYEYITPLSQADSLYHNMLTYLNKYSGYVAELQTHPMKCLVLVRTSPENKIATKGGTQITNFLKIPSVTQNASLDYMVSNLNATDDITNLPVIDETGYGGKVDLKFSKIKDLRSFQKELSRYDLALEEANRTILMLVIKEKN